MNEKADHKLTGVLSLILLATIYGFVGYFAREVAPGLTLMQQMYMRLALASPIFWLIFHRKIDFKNVKLLMKTEPVLVIARAIFLFALPVPMFIYATLHAKLANVAFLQILPYTFVMGALINKERLTKTKICLVLISLVGASLISLKNGISFDSFGRGELASIISGIIFSIGYVTRKKHKAKVNDYELSFTIIFISTLLCFLASMLLFEGLPHSALSVPRLSILLVIVSFINCFIILLANYGFRNVKDSLANNLMALEGVFALIFGFLIYKESPVPIEILGALIIMAAAISSAYLVKDSQ